MTIVEQIQAQTDKVKAAADALRAEAAKLAQMVEEQTRDWPQPRA